MGTSSSGKGSGSNSPLLPSWMDLDVSDLENIPTPSLKRFQNFRTQLGKFVSTMDGDSLRKSLKSFATTSSGGRAVASKRLSGAANVGTGLIAALGGFSSEGGGYTVNGLDLKSLEGMSVESAVQKISDAIVPDNGDADNIKDAIETSLLDVMGDNPEFSLDNMTNEMLTSLFTSFLKEMIFLWIISESGSAFQKTDDPRQLNRVETKLRDYIKIEVEDVLSNLNTQDMSFDKNNLKRLSKDIIERVFEAWEDYEDE